MATTTVQFRMDTEVKEEVEQLFKEMGLTMTTAMNLFAKAVINSGKIPFEIKAGRHISPELKKDLLDVQQKRNMSREFSSADELFEDLGI